MSSTQHNPVVRNRGVLHRARQAGDTGGKTALYDLVPHFFAPRLKYSRWIEVTLVPDERVETLVRTLVDHLAAFGGVPLVAVFDRPKTVALKWGRDGVVTEWNPTFAGVALDLGLGVEVCWPYRPQEKGAVPRASYRATRSTARPRRLVTMKRTLSPAAVTSILTIIRRWRGHDFARCQSSYGCGRAGRAARSGPLPSRQVAPCTP